MKKVKDTFDNLVFSAKLIISASPKYFILNTLFSITSALMPYIPMVLWKEILNKLSFLEYQNDINSQNFLAVIALLVISYALALIIEKTIGLFNIFVNYKYTDEVGYYLDNYIVDKVATVELAFYDSSKLNNNLANVSSHLRSSTENMVNTVFRFINGVIQLVVAVVMICTLNFWMIPVIIVLIVPSILQSKYVRKVTYEFEKDHSLAERKMGYYKDLFFNSCREELKLYNAHGFFRHFIKKTGRSGKMLSSK